MLPKKMRTPTIHRTEIIINKPKLKGILEREGLDYQDLYRQIVQRFGLDISYKGFMSIIAGKATWKLLYAYAVADVLNVEIMDIFQLIKVDVEQVKREKENHRKRYPPNR